MIQRGQDGEIPEHANAVPGHPGIALRTILCVGSFFILFALLLYFFEFALLGRFFVHFTHQL